MTEKIIASRQGDRPYVLVPKNFADSLSQYLVKQGFSGSYAAIALNGDVSDWMLDGTPAPKDIEDAIDAWFQNEGIETKKTKEPPDSADPDSIYWRFKSPN